MLTLIFESLRKTGREVDLKPIVTTIEYLCLHVYSLITSICRLRYSFVSPISAYFYSATIESPLDLSPESEHYLRTTGILADTIEQRGVQADYCLASSTLRVKGAFDNVNSTRIQLESLMNCFACRSAPFSSIQFARWKWVKAQEVVRALESRGIVAGWHATATRVSVCSDWEESAIIALEVIVGLVARAKCRYRSCDC